MYSTLRHPCDMPSRFQNERKCLVCGLCGSRYLDCRTKKCEVCRSSVHLGRTQSGLATRTIAMTYEFYRWRVSAVHPPSYVRVIIEVATEEELDRNVWSMVINADLDSNKTVVEWLKSLDEDSLKRHEKLALDIAYTNWTHRRVVFLLFQITKIFSGNRSKVALYSHPHWTWATGEGFDNKNEETAQAHHGYQL